MKKIFLLIILVCFFSIRLFAAESIIEFRLAYDHEKPNTILMKDEAVGKIYVAKRPVIVITDIMEARVIINKERPPWWLESAAKKSGAEIPHHQIYIEVLFNDYGKEKFGRITSDNIENILAIFIDGELVMAPKIIDKVDSGKARITTSYTEDEANRLVKKINENINKK